MTTERKDIIGESDTVTEKDENMNGSNMTVDVNGSLNESIDNQEDFDGISVSPEMKKVLIGENMLIAVDSDDTGNTDMMLFDGLKEYYGLPNNEYREFWVQDIDMDGTAEVGFVIYDYIFCFIRWMIMCMCIRKMAEKCNLYMMMGLLKLQAVMRQRLDIRLPDLVRMISLRENCSDIIIFRMQMVVGWLIINIQMEMDRSAWKYLRMNIMH